MITAKDVDIQWAAKEMAVWKEVSQSNKRDR